ncbi:unknown [Bacteroides stercoris CAG:120]|nr:unknown [Bacteroides stercoris CAG:120]
MCSTNSENFSFDLKLIFSIEITENDISGCFFFVEQEEIIRHKTKSKNILI